MAGRPMNPPVKDDVLESLLRLRDILIRMPDTLPVEAAALEPDQPAGLPESGTSEEHGA